MRTLHVLFVGVWLAWPVVALADGPTDPPDKGGTRPEALALPSGPGSLAGMGEQVGAEPATGALTLSVPVVLPPLPTGVEPDLALRYDSRSGNGPLGIGWSLSSMAIQRRTDLGLPRYDESDELLWSGQRLVEVQPGTYRLRVEGEFTRVVKTPSGFRADRKDGTQIALGETAQAEVVQDGRVFRWLPKRVTSVHGDTADYLYAADGSQRYLQEIDIARGGVPLVQIKLRYESRPDALPDARAGYLVVTAQRLAAIDTFVSGGSGGGLVRSLRLTYDDSTGLSRLKSLQTCAADGLLCLPPVSLAVTQPDFSAAAAQLLAPPGAWLGDPDTALVDVDGDSLPDVVRVTGEGTRWWHNLGPAGFAAGQPVAGAPGVALSSEGVVFQDMDGDGRAELVFPLGRDAEDGQVYVPFTVSGTIAAPVASMSGSVGLSAAAGFPPNGSDVRWVDLDSDGRVDALQATPAAWTAWFNLGDGTLSAPVELTAPETGLSFEDPTVRLADMNGDGLVDVVRLQSGIARVFLNLGFGNFGAGRDLAGAPEVGGDDLRLYLGDADGDGLSDVFYVAPGRVSIWRNLGGAGFGAEIAVAGAPDYDPVTTTVRVADLLGHGVRGIVYSGGSGGQPFLWFLDPTSGVRPNLITTVDNGMGGTRAVEFTSTGALLGAALADGTPVGSVVPFPVSVVARLAQSDGVSPVQLEQHAYRDPFYDPAERLFEGFATAETVALGDVHAASLDTTLTLHTGRNEDLCLVGKTAVQEERATDGTLLRRTRQSWEARPVAAALDGEAVAFAANLETDAESWEGGAAPKIARTRRQFDQHGNLLEEDDDGWLGAAVDPEAATIHVSYAEDERSWILGKLVEREVRNAAGDRISDERHFYDGAAFAGLPAGQLTLGDEMRQSAWVDGDNFVDVRRFTRDRYGNTLVSLDADGRRLEIDYDQARQQFPVEERHLPDGVGAGVVLHFRVAVDPATGQAVTYTEADGATTQYAWDGLGRLSSIERPTDPTGDPAEKLTYVLSPAERSLTQSRRSAPGGTFDVVAVDLFDGLLRPLASAQSAEQQGQLAISKRVARDARGNAAQTFGAYFASDLAAAPPAGIGITEDFRDPLGRLVRRLLPAGGELLWVVGPGFEDRYDALASAGQAEASRANLDWRGRTSGVELDPGGPHSRAFAFARDAAGRLVGRTSPLGAVTSASYDGLGRLTSLSDPDVGTITTTFDGAGHRVARVDARGQQLEWTYDQAGRVLDESDASGSRAHYCYDDAVACGAGSNSPGRLLFVADQSGTNSFAYDSNGRMVGATITQGGRAYRTSFDLDGADRLTRVHYPDGSALEFQYGGRDLVTAIPDLLEQAAYTASGLPLRRRFANGMTVDLSRDSADRITGVSAEVNGAAVVESNYMLMASGAPSKRTDLSGATTFTLDDAERLSVENGSAGARNQVFDDDDRLVGRWSVPADARLPGANLAYGNAAGPHALAQSARGALRYDTAGDRTADGDLALTWDAAGQLVGASTAALQASYVYGFDGSRRTKAVAGGAGAENVATFGDLVEVRDGVLWKHVMVAGERIASLLGTPP